MKQIIGAKLYDTENARLIADNEFSDGYNRLKNGRCMHLFVTKKGNFFVHHESVWEAERSYIEPLYKDAAAELFEKMFGNTYLYAEIFGEPEEA